MARKRKGFRKSGNALSRLLGYLGVTWLVVEALHKVFDRAVVRFGHVVTFAGLGCPVVIMIGLFLRRKWKERAQRLFIIGEIEKHRISDSRHDYIIESDDYRRGNAKENIYRKVMALELLSAFGNACAKCSANDNGLDLDHFFLSKNEGGNFILRHRDGYLVNNAIPLCHTCNRSKSDRSYKTFFNAEELARTLEGNAKMTALLNAKQLVDADGAVNKNRRATKAA